jgi:hypothetical protein
MGQVLRGSATTTRVHARVRNRPMMAPASTVSTLRTPIDALFTFARGDQQDRQLGHRAKIPLSFPR